MNPGCTATIGVILVSLMNCLLLIVMVVGLSLPIITRTIFPDFTASTYDWKIINLWFLKHFKVLTDELSREVWFKEGKDSSELIPPIRMHIMQDMGVWNL